MASSLCAVHCLAGAFLAGATGVGSVLADERVELGLAGLAVLVGVFAFGSSFRRHRRWLPSLVALAALGPLSLALSVEWASLRTEIALSVLGACGLVLGHVLNLRASRAAAASDCC